MGLSFIIGATIFNIEVFLYYLLFCFFVFLMSIISDIRDFAGDKNNNIKTIPVTIGYKSAKNISTIYLNPKPES